MLAPAEDARGIAHRTVGASAIVDFVAGEAFVFVEAAAPVSAKVDANDAMVLSQAKQVWAEMCVTGDVALPKLGAVEGVRIATPR